MKKLLCLLIVSMLILSFCASGISREEYDNAISDYEILETKYNALEDSYNLLLEEPPETPEETVTSHTYVEMNYHDFKYKVDEELEVKVDEERDTQNIYFDTDSFILLQKLDDADAEPTEEYLQTIVKELYNSHKDDFVTTELISTKTIDLFGVPATKLDFTGISGKTLKGNYKYSYVCFVYDSVLYNFLYRSTAPLYSLYYGDYLALLDSMELPELEPTPSVEESTATSESASAQTPPVPTVTEEPAPSAPEEPVQEPQEQPTPQPQQPISEELSPQQEEPPQPAPQEESQLPQTDTASIVYWVSSGKSYHFSRDCVTLKRSKTILEGTLGESGKSDPCNVCAGG